MPKDFFEIGVADSFRPLAVRAKLPLWKLHDGVYEILGNEFAMRIRRGTGHGKDFLVTLSRKTDLSTDPLELSGEVGLALFAEYAGATEEAATLTARDGSPSAFRRVAGAAERFCLPYLLGRRADFATVQQFVHDKVENARAGIKKYHFPSNVREEWT